MIHRRLDRDDRLRLLLVQPTRRFLEAGLLLGLGGAQRLVDRRHRLGPRLPGLRGQVAALQEQGQGEDEDQRREGAQDHRRGIEAGGQHAHRGNCANLLPLEGGNDPVALVL